MFPFPFSFLGTSLSAEFSYSASAYCQDATDPTPTITGTSGGTFSAAEKPYPLKLKINVTAGQTWKFPLYLAPSGTSYHIDFGDGGGFSSTPYTSDATHTYTNAGDYIVQVGQAGDIVNVTFEYNTGVDNMNSVVEIQQWPENLGTTQLRFQRRDNATPLAITATNIPDFLPGTTLAKCFANISTTITDTGDNLSKWNLDNVTNMNEFFYGGASAPSTLNTDTKQVTYNGQTYIAWDVKGITSGNIGRGALIAGNNWNISNMTALSQLGAGANNADLERKQITLGTGSTARTYNQWDTENATSFGTGSNMGSDPVLNTAFNNYSIKNWVFNYTMSNTSQYLFFSYPAAWGGALSQNDNYTNCWIGWAIAVYNGWESEKGSNYAAGYLTDLNVQMHSHFNGKMNGSLSINSTIHSNIPSGWSTANDALTYLVEEQGWTIPYT